MAKKINLLSAVLLLITSSCATTGVPDRCEKPEEPLKSVNKDLNPPDELCPGVLANHFSRISINQTQCSEFDYWRTLMRHWYGDQAEEFRTKAWSCTSHIWSSKKGENRSPILTDFGCMFADESDADAALAFLKSRFQGKPQRFVLQRFSGGPGRKAAYIVHHLGSDKLTPACLERMALEFSKDKTCPGCPK